MRVNIGFPPEILRMNAKKEVADIVSARFILPDMAPGRLKERLGEVLRDLNGTGDAEVMRALVQGFRQQADA